MLTVFIDELTPCLVDAKTGDILETEVLQVTRKSFLRKFNKKTGWATNWASLLDKYDIYALVLEGSVDIQGLVALTSVDEFKAVFIAWACVNPKSNKGFSEPIQYIGIGGHLFAIAADISKKSGYGGALTGYAANEKLALHYKDAFGARIIAQLHPYQIFINEDNAQKNILEVYDYEWSEDKL